MGDIPEAMTVNVFIFADLQGLARSLQEAGTIEDEQELVQFTRHLSQAHHFVSFVDCGVGRKAVDAKMRGMTFRRPAKQAN